MPAPIIGAAALAGGAGIIGTAMSHFMGRSSAQSQMDFQERMSNTSYQRSVKDMLAAGLNPALAANLGGASTPLGTSAQTPDYSAPVRDAMSAYSAASAMRLQAAQARNLDADSVNKEIAGRVGSATEATQIQTSIQNLENLVQSGKLTAAQRMKVFEEIRNLEAQYKLVNLNAAHSALDIERATKDAEFFKSRFGSSAMIRKYLGNVPGAFSIGKGVYDSLGDKANAVIKKYRKPEVNRYIPAVEEQVKPYMRKKWDSWKNWYYKLGQ